MRGAVKSVTPNAVPAVQVIRDSVKVGLLWKRVMERGVEHGDLRHPRSEELARRQDSPDVVGIMQRRQVDAIFNALQHLVVDQRRFFEHLSAMHDAVPHGVNVAGAMNGRHLRLV